MTRVDWLLVVAVLFLVWFMTYHMGEPMAQARWLYLDVVNIIETFLRALGGR